MKTLILPLIAIALTSTPAFAAPGKTFGGFSPKQKIVLVVVEREVVRTKGFNVKDDAKIPKGVPKYAIGDNVTFKIGSRGQLLLDDTAIRFRESTDRRNYYSNKAPSVREEGHTATVDKGPKGKKATSAEVTFYSYKTEGLTLITHRVTYRLAK